jgi:hypothetical protein
MRTLATLLAAAAIAAFGFATPAHAGDVVVDLIADNGDDLGGILVGDVTVSGGPGNFTVTYDTSAGDWLIVEIHTHAVNEDDCSTVPQTKKGSPKVGHFDEATERSPASAVDNDSHTILGLDGNDSSVDNDIVCIAAHAVVYDSTAAGATPQERFDNSEETAWGDGDGTEFQEDRGWATYFTVDLVDLAS